MIPAYQFARASPPRVVVERRRDASRERRRLAKAEFVAVAQRSPVDPAERAAQIRRAASEDFRDVDASRERDVGATPSFGPAESERDSGRCEHGAPAAQRHRVDRRGEVGAADRDQRRLVELERGPDQRRFEARRAFFVSDEEVGEPKRHCVHRAADRHGIPLHVRAAEVLHGRLEPATHDSRAHARPIPEVGLRDGAEANAISGREQGRLRSRDVEDGQRRLADQVPSARRIERIHAGLAARRCRQCPPVRRCAASCAAASRAWATSRRGTRNRA